MKSNWQTKKLGEICDILDSKRKPVTQRDRISGKYPYYGATGIQDYVSEYIFDEKLILIGEDGAKWGDYTRNLRQEIERIQIEASRFFTTDART